MRATSSPAGGPETRAAGITTIPTAANINNHQRFYSLSDHQAQELSRRFNLPARRAYLIAALAWGGATMSAPTIIITPAGVKVAVRVVPFGLIDHDRAFTTYPLARAYAQSLRDTLGGASIDDQCENWTRAAQ